jgi:hypothetical protein
MTAFPAPLRRLSPILLLAASIPASAQEAPRPPANKWVVDFAASQCLASRLYGTGDDAVTLLVKPSPLGNVIQVALISKGRRGEAEQVAGQLTIDGHAPADASFLTYNVDGGEKQIVSVANLDQQAFAPLRQATRVRIKVGKRPDVTLQLTQMKQVTDALDTCVADLQAVWHVSAESNAALRESARPKRQFINLFTADDYPTVAIRQAQTGDLSFVLLIDEKGGLADCTVDQTSGVASLDAQSCFVFRTRAKFIPAVAADGQPAKSTLMGRIHWVLPSVPHKRKYAEGVEE